LPCAVRSIGFSKMDTADILFIGADPREFEGAMRFWTNIESVRLPVHWARSAVWKGKRIVAIANGAGPRRSAQAAIAVKYKVLVNLGFCGALHPALQIGDIVVGSAGRQPRTFRAHFQGPIASIDHIAQTAEEKRRRRADGSLAVEMELAGLIGLPCYAVKSVSDLAVESFANDLNSVLQPDGRMNISKLMLQACLKPVPRFTELLRLQKRAKLASNTLGEFLESCEF
jgi:uridine phosphorylase